MRSAKAFADLIEKRLRGIIEMIFQQRGICDDLLIAFRFRIENPKRIAVQTFAAVFG